MQGDAHFNLSSAKIQLFLEEKENKSTKRLFFLNLYSNYSILHKIESAIGIFSHKIMGTLFAYLKGNLYFCNHKTITTMDKKYEKPKDEPVMANEQTAPFVAGGTEVLQKEVPFDAPCQYSIAEVKNMLLQNRIDYKNGNYHSMTEVDKIMEQWC